MNGSALITPAVFTDCMMLVCVVASAALVFLKHESWQREEKVAEYVARFSFWLVPLLIIVMTETINAGIFHFSGFTGLIVTAVISLALFCAAPAWAAEHLCRKYIRRTAVMPDRAES